MTAPLVQLNTPYPSTAYLMGFLRRQPDLKVSQTDPGLQWFLNILSKDGLLQLQRLFTERKKKQPHPAVTNFHKNSHHYIHYIDPIIALLKNKDFSLAHRIASRTMLPEGPRFASLGPQGEENHYLDWAFGSLSTIDRARYLATLFIEDIVDAITHGVDPHFGFSKYGESLAQSQASFDALVSEVQKETLWTSQLLQQTTHRLLEQYRPDVVAMSIPFPGNVLGGLKMAKTIRRESPGTKIVWGGGYVNTELRDLSEPRLFDYVDAVCYDDGEEPLRLLLKSWGTNNVAPLLRTKKRQNNVVQFISDPTVQEPRFEDRPTPTYEGLPLHDYLGLIDMPNPMHRLWSDTRWNKLTVAHGCYWKRCTFCDLSLDYIDNYQPQQASRLADQIDAMIAETGQRGFHFVDEAAPPAVLKELAKELLRRQTVISWWGNIRFEKTFNPSLCKLLAESGCIAVTGGLEVASDRLLKLMDKGITVAQVAQVTHAFNSAGIRVHAYLMYGFPTETEQETIDALERVRQLFQNGCLDSAYWHRFSATAHSPVGQHPKNYGITLLPTRPGTFARNDLPFSDPTRCDHEKYGPGLQKAIYNYMRGLGLDEDVRSWFDFSVPKSTVAKNFVRSALRAV